MHELLQRLKNRKDLVTEINHQLREHLPQFSYVWFLTLVGLSEEGGVFSELVSRIEERLLPPIPPANDVLYLFHNLITEKDRDWIERVTPGQLGRFLVFIADNPNQEFAPLTLQMEKAVEILAQRISGMGLDPFIAKRLKERMDLLENFLELGTLTLDHDHFSEIGHFLDCLKKCERSLLFVRGRRELEGTSLGLTYRLFYIEELIHRLKMILSVAGQYNTTYRYSAIGKLFKHILLTHMEKRQVSRFLGRNIEILAYQVTILTGNTGEHYIASDSKELRSMWWKAIKGGIVVAFLVVIKLLVSKHHVAPLPQALIYGSIYALGFLVIHLVGGVLATKQPAMTASTLAAALGNDALAEENDLEGLAKVIVRMLRTQIAALLGNYLTAFPVAVAIVFPFLVAGIPIASPEKAQMIIHDVHPWLSLSFMYAAIAGVCLFLSGLLCGLADNWFAFNQIAQRWENIFSGPKGRKISKYFQKNFGIWVGNITLGFMLGSMYSVGEIVGLPLDIRHVTFASGSFGLGWIHGAEMMPWGLFALIAASVFIMGLINLTVSFSLSLFVAAKSRRLKFSQGGTLVWLLFKSIAKSPLQLFFTKE